MSEITDGYFTEIEADWTREGTGGDLVTDHLRIPIAAAKLKDPRVIDGVFFDGISGIYHYGVCTTTSSQILQVSVNGGNGFSLVTGAKVVVYFNNVSSITDPPKLSVNGLEAKVIIMNGRSMPVRYFENERTFMFVYDPTYEFEREVGAWILVGDIGSDTVNTFRQIKVNGTSFLASTSGTALNLIGGTRIGLSTGSNGALTFSTTAEVNQNAFSNVTVGLGGTYSQINADSKTDTLTITQGRNVTLTPNISHKSIDISVPLEFGSQGALVVGNGSGGYSINSTYLSGVSGGLNYGGTFVQGSVPNQVRATISQQLHDYLSASGYNVQLAVTSGTGVYIARDCPNFFLICQGASTFDGNSFTIGDWLISDGTNWSLIQTGSIDFGGADPEQSPPRDGYSGLVPQPTISGQDYNKYLKGDGSWSYLNEASSTLVGGMKTNHTMTGLTDFPIRLDSGSKGCVDVPIEENLDYCLAPEDSNYPVTVGTICFINTAGNLIPLVYKNLSTNLWTKTPQENLYFLPGTNFMINAAENRLCYSTCQGNDYLSQHGLVNTSSTYFHGEERVYLMVSPTSDRRRFSVVTDYNMLYGETHLTVDRWYVLIGTIDDDTPANLFLEQENHIYYCDEKGTLIDYATYISSLNDYSAGNDITISNNQISTDLSTNYSIHSGRTATYGVFNYSLCAVDIEGHMQSFTRSGDTGTSKVINYTAEFPIGCKLYASTRDYDPITNYYQRKFITTCKDLDLRYTGNIVSSNFSNTSSSYPVYLAVDVSYNTDGKAIYWNPSNKLNQLIIDLGNPNLTEGDYILIGYKSTTNSNSDTWYISSLEMENPLYHYDGTRMIDWATYIADQTYTAGTGIDITSNTISSVIEDVTVSTSTPSVIHTIDPYKVYSFTGSNVTYLNINLSDSLGYLKLYHFYVGPRSANTSLVFSGNYTWKPGTTFTLISNISYEFSIMVTNGVARIIYTTWS